MDAIPQIVAQLMAAHFDATLPSTDLDDDIDVLLKGVAHGIRAVLPSMSA